jgi:hypothetical protein
MARSKVPLPEPAPAEGSASNRRATVRYHCAPATPGRVLLVEKQEMQRAWVLDLSLTGVGLLVPRPLAAGLLIVVRMQATLGEKVYELPARVAHSTREPGGDYVVGCELITRLTPEELDALL